MSKDTPPLTFNLIVHALEIGDLAPALMLEEPNGYEASFDGFVKKVLSPSSPTGTSFIRLYPYFVHKKAAISASAVSENLTATFGQSGFVLNVPLPNFVVSAPTDIGSPVDHFFYDKKGMDAAAPFRSFGDALMKQKVYHTGLMSREALLPDEALPIKGGTRPFVWFPPKEPEKFFEAISYTSGMSSEAVEVLKQDKDCIRGLSDFSRGKLLSSWYNEITLNPFRSFKDRVSSAVTINGIFLRTSRENLSTFCQRSSVKELWKVAEAFDLPVVFINDGRDYTVPTHDR